MKKLLILCIVLIIYLLVTKKSCVENLKSTEVTADRLYNGSKWNSYRLGDIVLQPGDSVFYDKNHGWNILYHTKQFPGSIAGEYLKLNTNKKYGNVELLKQIISKMDKNISIPDTTLVLHIRIGDVLCERLSTDSAPDVYAKRGNESWWKGIIKYIKKNKITNVVIVAGTHFKKCLKESVDYIQDRAEYLKNKADVSVEFRLGQPPDEDLLYCKNAKHFTSTGGGFGKILKLLGN